eukprot:715076-Pelagomonas_calceolata.AAC.4
MVPEACALPQRSFRMNHCNAAGKPLHQLVSEAGEKTRALKANRPTARELSCNEVPRQGRWVQARICTQHTPAHACPSFYSAPAATAVMDS